MGAQDKIKVGQFLARRQADPDDPEDLLAPGGNIPAENSFLEQYRPEIVLSRPAPVPFQNPPALSQPHAPPFMPAPALSSPSGPPRPAPPGVTPTHPVEHTPTFTEPPRQGPIQRDFGPGGQQYGNDVVQTELVDFKQPAGHIPDPAPRVIGDPLYRAPEVEERAPSLDTTPHRPELTPITPPPDGVGTYPSANTDPLRTADDTIRAAIRAIDADGRYAAYVGWPVNAPGDLLADPTLYAKQLARISGLFQSNPGMRAAVVASMAGLQAMNREGTIFNPATIAPVPLAELHVANSLEGTLRLANRKVAGQVAEADDLHLQLSRGTYDRTYLSDDLVPHSVKLGGTQLSQNNPVVGAKSQNGSLVDNAVVNPFKPIVGEALKARNRHFDVPGELNKYEENPAFRLVDVIDTAITQGDDAVKRGLSALFTNPHPQLTTQSEHRPLRTTFLATDSVKSDKMYRANFNSGVIPAKFKGENRFGFTTKPNSVTDLEAQVPLSFTDLRPIGGGNKYRTVFFRPFITSFGESFSPQWNLQNYYGRTDQVAGYMSTGRTVNLGFQVAAFTPQDVNDIWQKLHWLTSMVYPLVDSSLIMRSGPVIRMRVGNVIDGIGADGNRGLPGILQSLDYDYTDKIWELKDDFKVPRNIGITVSFLVLHDRPMGVGEHGKFGGIGTVDPQTGYVPPTAQIEEDRAKLAQVDDGLSFRAIGKRGFQTYVDVNDAEAS